MTTHPSQSSPHFLHSLIAIGLVCIVIGLGLMSASPDLHNWVHQTHSQHDDTHSHEGSDLPSSDANHSCAIVAYAGGITLSIDTATLVALPALESPAQADATEPLRIASPAYLLPPGRGPPTCLS